MWAGTSAAREPGQATRLHHGLVSAPGPGAGVRSARSAHDCQALQGLRPPNQPPHRRSTLDPTHDTTRTNSTKCSLRARAARRERPFPKGGTLERAGGGGPGPGAGRPADGNRRKAQTSPLPRLGADLPRRVSAPHRNVGSAA